MTGDRRQTGWSTMTEDGKAVIGQFWIKQFVDISAYGPGRFYVGQTVADHVAIYGRDRPSFKKWREHLNWAWVHNKDVLVIEVTEKNNANVFNARKDVVMRLISFDSNTGAYVAQQEPANAHRA